MVAKEAIVNGIDQSNSRVFDASKVGDHHAIIPDEIPQEDLRLSEDEQKVYSIVMKRFLAAFLPSAEKEETTVTFSVAEKVFMRKNLGSSYPVGELLKERMQKLRCKHSSTHLME